VPYLHPEARLPPLLSVVHHLRLRLQFPYGRWLRGQSVGLYRQGALHLEHEGRYAALLVVHCRKPSACGSCGERLRGQSVMVTTRVPCT
jgi:hypothetical protein